MHFSDTIGVLLGLSAYAMFIFGMIASVVLFFALLPLPYRFRKVKKQHENRVVALSVAAGFLSGLLIRYLQFGFSSQLEIMSASFIILSPMIVGAVSVFFLARDGQLSLRQSITLPWLPASLSLGCTLLLAWEGIICTALFLPLFMFLASVGGMIAKLICDQMDPKNQAKHVYISLLLIILPFASFPIEQNFTTRQQITRVSNVIIVKAPIDRVWPEVKSVSKIAEQELEFSFARLFGFPRPIEATLHGSGVGAIRRASFSGNLVFTEKITEWQKGERINFSITANTADIPPTTLDEHVTIGGPYFDVLEGEYLLTSLDSATSKITLSSHFRISTHFNWYATYWARFIMDDIQSSILTVLKKRVERPTDS